MKKYPYLDGFLSAKQIRHVGVDVQRAVMEAWFYKNFENPAEVTPWVEGEYLYIYGGPYDPDSVLEEEFMGIIPEKIIQSLVDELTSRTGWEWAPTSDGDYSQHDEFFGFDEIPQNPYTDFIRNINNVETWLQSAEDFNSDRDAKLFLNQMLYVGIITALEAYLSNTFLTRINEDEKLFHRLVETYDGFKVWKIPLSKIHSYMEGIKKIVQNEFTVRFDWHSMDKAKKIYKKILCVEFPEYASISDAIKVRHAIIHRNETTLKDGSVIASKHVKALAVDVRKFVEYINKAMLSDALKEESEKK